MSQDHVFILHKNRRFMLWPEYNGNNTQEAQTEATFTPALILHWSQTDLSSVYIELVWFLSFFFFALSAASMYRQNAQTLPSLPLKAKAWYKTVTSLSFDCKGLFTSPYQDSIYSIFVLIYFVTPRIEELRI